MCIGFPSVEVYRNHLDSPQLKGFLNHVFKQVDTDRFMEVFQEAVQKDSPEEIYRTLLQGAQQAKGNPLTQAARGWNALQGERDTLAENVAKVMDPQDPKDGYVEIGMPGRMIQAIAPLMGLKGRITVVNEFESRIQSGWIKPYHAYHALTYAPLPLDKESVDVISVFPGLHHCPEDKLDAFIESIHKTLREGGTFLLREHDGRDSSMKELACIVHSVFNACTGVSEKEEAKEVRNFKGLNEWQTLLESKGFQHVPHEPLIREGDSSENALMKFVKVSQKEGQLEAMRQKIFCQQGQYTRPAENTHLTAVEWFNVESSQNLSSKENFWDYPYFRDSFRAVTTFFKSWRAARQEKSLSHLATCEYMGMNAVLLSMMSAEYLTKGSLYTPLWLGAQANKMLWKGTQDPQWTVPSQQYQNWFDSYGKQLEVTPYYAQKYLPAIGQCWRQMAQSWKETRTQRGFFNMIADRQTAKNLITAATFSTDMLFREALARPMNWLMGGEEQGDARTIGLIVEGTIEQPEGCQLITEETSLYTGIISPRYKGLEATLKSIFEQGGKPLEIAGHEEIHVDVVLDQGDACFDQTKVYQRDYLPDSNKVIVACKVAVSELEPYLAEGVLHRVYDF